MEAIYYPYNEKLVTTQNRIKKSKARKKNIELALKFGNFLISRGLKAPRIEKHLDNLSRILKWLDKDFEKVTRDDIEWLVSKINMTPTFSEWTKYDYKRTIKAFWNWLGKPEVVDWIVLTTPRRYKLPEEILTEEEIKKMIEACENLRDKAIISVLYESGCRIGEFLNLRIKHVHFDDKGAVLIVDGKTGRRRVRIVSSVPYLIRYLDQHPDRDNPNAPLWVKVWHPGKGKPVTADTISKQLKKIAKKAGIKKRIHPHLFRHSRATHLANYLTEAQMCEFFGWVQGSDMPRIYIHLSGRDVDDAILSIYGLSQKEEKSLKFNVVKCPRCDAINEEEARFCMKCGFPLTKDAEIDELAFQTLIEEAHRDLLRDPRFRYVMDAMSQEISMLRRELIKLRNEKKENNNGAGITKGWL